MNSTMETNKIKKKGYNANYSPFRNVIYTISSIIILIIIWNVVSVIVGQEIQIPSPASTFNKLIEIIHTEEFWSIVISTVVRCLITFTISFIAGIIFGFISGFWRPMYYFLQPLVIIIKSTPIISFILLALIWFRYLTPVFVGFLIVFPVIYINVVEGIRNVDSNLIEMAKMYEVKKSRIIREVYLPSIASYISAGISIALGMNIKAVVAAEALSQPNLAIGTSLQDEAMYLETAGLFAWTFVIIMISFMFEWIFRLIKKRIERWR